MSLSKSAFVALSAAFLLPLLPLSAQALPLVTNGSFETVAAGVTGKTTFANNVPGWSGGTNLTFIDYPGTADNGSYLSVYGPFPNQSPDGGKFVEADGDPTYRSAITQMINGLIVGQSYTLTFQQAAGQQQGFTGPTTERWQVSLGGDTQLSSQFSLLQGGVGQWQSQTMVFVASATSELLSFLASGTPNGAPPISFLDGVSLVQTVPEPVTLSLLGTGVLGALMLRRRAKPAA